MMTEQRTARILVVDDEETIRLTLARLLQRRGYTVTVAASGTEARALIEQQAFDLLLLDLVMPGLSGLDVAALARTIQPTAAILILTGSSEIEGAPSDLQLDDFPYMLKTASPQDVLARVADMVA
jgi:DNA-binding response OmpR family regulator